MYAVPVKPDMDPKLTPYLRGFMIFARLFAKTSPHPPLIPVYGCERRPLKGIKGVMLR